MIAVEQEHVCCEACGCGALDDVRSRNSWRLVRCRECDLVFLNPRPTFDAMHSSFEWFQYGLTSGRKRGERQ